jgi:hypothetical protein
MVVDEEETKTRKLTTVMSPLLLPLFQTQHAGGRGGGSRGHWVQAQNNGILGAAQLPTTHRGSPSHHFYSSSQEEFNK